jgi:small-conductance mechanosensitive channel
MIVPLSYFIEKPFQNWTRDSTALIGSAFFYLDYRAPVDRIREKLGEIVKQSKNWNGQVVSLAVTDTKPGTIELRALMSANTAGQAFDLRCEVREKMVEFLQAEHPHALPVQRSIAEICSGPTELAQAARDAPKARKSAGR